jgi:hypothetical protein
VTNGREAMNSMFVMAYGIFEGEFERRLYKVLHTPEKRVKSQAEQSTLQ